MEQTTFDTLSIARRYVAAGLSVIPIRQRSKEPEASLLPRVHNETTGRSSHSWKMYQERVPHVQELEYWYKRDDVGVGIIGGGVSGGLLILDLESGDAYDQWRTNVTELLPAEVMAQFPVVATGKGRHVYLRCKEPGGNRKLATDDARQVIAETRGEGGYVLAPPSIHPSGAVYQLIQGDLTAIPYLDDAQVRAVLDVARALAPAPEYPTSTSRQGGSVIEAFNQAYTIVQILEAHGYQQARPGRYIRPGGERGSVVVRNDKSIHFNTNDPLYAEAPGGGNYSHTPFSAWCILVHNRDVKAAVRAAAIELGITRNSDPPTNTDELLTRAGRCLGIGEQDNDTWPYFILEGGMWMEQTANDGSPKLPLLLTNFTARITAETSLHDGEMVEEQYTLMVHCQRRTRTIEMKRCDFEGDTALSRIVAALGARARVNPRAQARYVMDAIKAFSQNIEEHTIYTHTGWVQGRYLLSNGYVDRTGWHPASSASASHAHLPQRLSRYRLTPPSGSSVQDGLRVLDDLLDLAPSSVMVPLLGGIFLAPVLQSIGAPAPMVHLYGPTGSYKTSVSCAALALLGDFSPAHPTDTWTSTANSIQRLGWHLKDATMLLDDYKAANIKANQVTFLLQNYGDGMARGRLDANSEARAAFPVRAVLISSGEDQPEGEASTLARILSVDLPRGAVHRGKLSGIQHDAACLHHITIDYLSWLANRAEGDDRINNEALHQGTRAAILNRLEQTDYATNPGRVASNVAALYVAWDTFGQFLRERGHWPAERVDAWIGQCKRDLVNLARQQLELTTNERYSQLFLETVRELIASGKAVIVDAERDSPVLGPGQVLIGARDHAGVYLIAGTAYDEVCKHTRAAGRNVVYTKRALGQLLDQDGLLLSTSRPSLTVQRRINGARLWCWHLSPSVVD